MTASDRISFAYDYKPASLEVFILQDCSVDGSTGLSSTSCRKR
jgi:hypothetical protein